MCTDCAARLARDLDSGFPAFVGHHQDLVYGLALRMTRRPADAEDLAQETFLRAFRALRTYQRERIVELRPRGWLAAIAVNLARNRARRHRAGSVAGNGLRPLDAVALEAGPHGTGDPRQQPEAVVERREAAREWQARLDALPRAYRLAVELRHVEGLSYPELAEALGRPIGTVKSDVHRGVALLRRAWRSEAGVESREGEVVR